MIAGISAISGSSATTLNGPYDVCFGPNNTFYIADYNNNRIQKYVYGSGTGTTVSNLSLSNPSQIYMNNNGVMYILDNSNYRVLQWTNNAVITVAGGHGNGGALNQLGTSYGMYVDANSNIYIGEFSNHRVTLWTASNPNISQVVCFVFE